MATRTEVGSITPPPVVSPASPVPGADINLEDALNTSEENVSPGIKESLKNLKPIAPPLSKWGLTVQENTTLDQIISNLPWEDEFSYGCGVNAVTGQACASALEKFNPIDAGTTTSHEVYRVISSKNDYE